MNEWHRIKTYTVPAEQTNPALPSPADWDALMINIGNAAYQAASSGVDIYNVLSTGKAINIDNRSYGALVTMEISGDAVVLRQANRSAAGANQLNIALPTPANVRQYTPYFSGKFAAGTVITMYIKPRKNYDNENN